MKFELYHIFNVNEVTGMKIELWIMNEWMRMIINYY